MKERDVFTVLFQLLEFRSVEMTHICYTSQLTESQVLEVIDQLRKSGLVIEEDLGVLTLKLHWVFHKKFLTFQEFLKIRNDTMQVKPLQKRGEYRQFAKRLISYEPIRDIVYDLWDNVYVNPRSDSHAIATSYLALQQSRIVSLDYIDVDDKETFRRVEPLEVFYRQGTWYLWAFCQMRHDVRLFRLTDQMDIHLTDHHYHKRPYLLPRDIEHDEHETYLVNLQFAKTAIDQLKIDFDLDQIIEAKNGYRVDEADLYDPEYAMAFLLKYGSDAKIIEPKQLQNLMMQRFKDIIKSYKK